jgi:hypothetical protein
MPRRGAPQPHGPGSDEAYFADDPETAKMESIFSTFPLSHFLQVTWLVAELTIFSNLVPQSRHWYSKIGIRHLARCRSGRIQYIEFEDSYQAHPAAGTLGQPDGAQNHGTRFFHRSWSCKI